MANRFSQVTSKGLYDPTKPRVEQLERIGTLDKQESRSKLSPSKKRIGREAYDTLMGLLSEGTETPTTPYGVLVANSTKRSLRKQIESIFEP